MGHAQLGQRIQIKRGQMKTALFSFIPVSDNSMVASTRIASFIENELQMQCIWDERIANYTDLDILFIVNGAYAFCKVLEELSLAILGAKRIVWVQNDYTIVPPINDGSATSPFRNAFVARRKVGKSHLEFWTTCEKESKATPLSTYINWNCLSMRAKPLSSSLTSDDVVYYGSYRRGREAAFERYFKLPKCKMTISSPSRKFGEIYQSNMIKHVGRVEDLSKWLSERGLGLYLEDRKSHREFHSPPNRFYEMLSAGLPIAFEEEAGMTLRKAGYNPAPYLVGGALPLARMLDLRNKIQKEQFQTWYNIALAERNALSGKIKAAYKQLKGANFQ
jgi:hypothetical protein